MAICQDTHPSREGAALQWAMVDGRLTHVSSFHHLPPPARPKALCPVCEKPVIMKLGNERIHHCAHLPGDQCEATVPDTALHLNCKFHLYTQLLQADRLFILLPCSSAFQCQASLITTWMTGWEDVELEYNMGARRPDIALLKDGRVIGAIEILVTHEVDEEKEAYLHSLGIPWIEVLGTEELHTGDTAWTADLPLECERTRPYAEQWICSACHDHYVAIYEQEIKRLRHDIDSLHNTIDQFAHETCHDCDIELYERAIELLSQDNRKLKYEIDQIARAPQRKSTYVAWRVHAWRVVDSFFPSGKKYRAIYTVEKGFDSSGVCARVALKHYEKDVLYELDGPLTEDTKDSISKKCDDFLKQKESTGIVDRPMKWALAPVDPLCRRIHWSNRQYTPRYYWDKSRKKWLKRGDFDQIRWGGDWYMENE